MKTIAALIFCAFLCCALDGTVRAAEVDCTSSQLQVANNAVSIANSALDQVIGVLDSPDPKATGLMQKWFGVASADVASKIKKNLIASRVYTNTIAFKCANSTDISIGDVYAYVRADNAFVVVLSAWFFGQTDSGYYSRPGLLIHEMTHFYLTAGTGDAEGSGDWISICQKLAIDDPNKAQNTAYNYEFFVEAYYFGIE
jgi:peptidyl-Lys metalloendopeptidase